MRVTGRKAEGRKGEEGGGRGVGGKVPVEC